MAMNVRPVPTLDTEVNDIRLATAETVNEDILPAEDKLWGWMAQDARRRPRRRLTRPGSSVTASKHAGESWDFGN